MEPAETIRMQRDAFILSGLADRNTITHNDSLPKNEVFINPP
jgi:hypothetical protein